MQMQEESVNFKVLIVGDVSVGKSAMLLRYTEDKFVGDIASTIAIDFKVKKLDLDGTPVKLQLWDTAGQERYRTISTSYYKNAHAVVLTFDITNLQSFQNISRWVNDVHRYCTASSSKKEENGKVVMILVGTKSDKCLSDEEERQVSKKAAYKLANKLKIAYFETSAKNGVEISKAFYYMAVLLNENNLKNNVHSRGTYSSSSLLNLAKATRCPKSKSCSC